MEKTILNLASLAGEQAKEMEILLTGVSSLIIKASDEEETAEAEEAEAEEEIDEDDDLEDEDEEGEEEEAEASEEEA
jgi:hypothetical protein